MKTKIEKWFKQKLWTEQMVLNAAVKGLITAAEAEAIIHGISE